MKIKTVEISGKIYAEIQDGKPVYHHDDGKEIPFDAVATVATISRLNGEAKGHREAKEEALGKLKAFEGIEDPGAARNALATIKNLDAKKLVDAGEVEKIKSEATRAMEDRIKAVEESYGPVIRERDEFKAALHAEKVGGSFARSKMIADKLAIPPDMVQARFGSNFKVEGNDVVAYDSSGNKIYSRAKPGDLAPFDEALDMLIEAYPHKDHILKGTGASGGGSSGSGTQGGKRTVTRAQLDKMPPTEQRDTSLAAGRGEIVLTD